MSFSLITNSLLFKKVVGNKVFRNFSYLTIGTLLSQLLSLISILRITRLLSPSEYGVFTFLNAQGALLFVIGSLGTSSVFIRTIARDSSQTKNLVYNGLKLRTSALLLTCSLYLIYNNLFGSLSTGQLFLVFAFSLVNAFFSLAENVFYGYQMMLTPSLISLIYSFSWLIVVYSVSQDVINVTVLFYLFLLLNALKTFFYLFFLKKQKLLSGSVSGFIVTSKRLFKESRPYFMMVLILLPISSFSSNFLDINSDIKEVGYYNLSARTIGPIFLVISSVYAAIFPNLSSLWDRDKNQFNKAISIGVSFFFLFTLALCFLFNLFAKEIVVLLFPHSYLPAVEVCKMQIWHIFLTSVDSLIGTILGAANREKLILRFAILYFIVSTPIFFYGSKFGAFGLSCGYVISFSICMLYVWNTFTKVLEVKVKHSTILWCAAVVLFLMGYFIPSDFFVGYKILISMLVISLVGVYSYRLYPLIALK